MKGVQVVTVDGALDEFECPIPEERLRAVADPSGSACFSSLEDREIAKWALKIAVVIDRARR